MDCEQIQRDALALPEAERAELAHCLLQIGKPLSDEAPEPQLAEARIGESGRRGGESRPAPAAEPMSEWRKVQQAALALPEAERDELCRNLLLSLEPQEGLVSEEEAEAYWLQEAERRLARRQRGEVELIPYEQVLRELGESSP